SGLRSGAQVGPRTEALLGRLEVVDLDASAVGRCLQHVQPAVLDSGVVPDVRLIGLVAHDPEHAVVAPSAGVYDEPLEGPVHVKSRNSDQPFVVNLPDVW